MSEYENYVAKAHMAMSAAAEWGGKITRAEYLAEAQVHATLAVAAALMPPIYDVLGVDDRTMTDVPTLGWSGDEQGFTGSERADVSRP